MQQQGRLELIDSVRGFALMGLFLVHSVELFELYWLHPTPGPVTDWVYGLFAGKAYALFALCFGLSFYIIMDGAARKGVDFAGRFAWRLALLFLFGIVHGLVYRGDILQVLALLGLLLIPFYQVRSNRVLVLLSLFFLLQPDLLIRSWAALQGAAWANHAPFFFVDASGPVLANGSFGEAVIASATDGAIMKWSFFFEFGRASQIIGLFLAGLVLGRIGFFADPEKFRIQRRTALAIAAIAWVILRFAKPAVTEMIPSTDAAFMGRVSIEWAFDCWMALALMIVELILFVELYQALRGRVLGVLAPAGRMTLTLYVMQSLIGVPIFYGFGLGLHDDLTSAQALAIGVVIFAGQLLFARFWFRRFHYGPLEWLWRALTRTTTDVPFVKRELASSPA